MNYKALVKATAATLVLITLVGCSTTNTGGTNPNGSIGAYQPGGAKTMGLGVGDTVNGLNTSSSPNRMKAPYNQIYFFDFDSSDLHSDDVGSVDVQGNYLAANSSSSVLLTGNTDDRGSREYNIALGQRRALAVANKLKMDGAKQNQISVVSYGAEKPIAPGDNDNSWSENRNVQLTYQSK